LKHFLLLIVSVIIFQSAFTQHNISFVVLDSKTQQGLDKVSVQSKSFTKGAATDDAGRAVFNQIKDTASIFNFTRVGYKPTSVTLSNLQADTTITVYLTTQEEQLDEVIVTSTRTNSRMEDLPTKVEVLGSEEVAEENGIKPGNIAGLLGDIAGIQIQQTSATTGNADMRVQGLPGKYTQLLRDGMPMFGGYSGSFSILQIPPLDLQQIEIIKGASSTLYGGGAIAGMVNLVSKRPKLNKPEHALTINRSTLKENNFNAFFSGRNEKVGYTVFGGGTLQNAVDVNKDGFSEVPETKSVFIHPRLFFYTSPSSTLIFGYTLNYEDRNGGDMNALKNEKSNQSLFFISNKSIRNTIDAQWEKKFGSNGTLLARGSGSFFNRDITSNVFGMKAHQLSYFTEVSYAQKTGKHNWVGGINFQGNDFTKKRPDSSFIPETSDNTIGLFAQDDWKLTDKLTAQPGVRVDNNNLYGTFFLPRLSLMYKFNPHFTSRLGGGYGYKAPTLFSAEIDERDYKRLAGYAGNVAAEKSLGANFDINYKGKLDEWNLTVNQTFYITQINDPLLLNDITGRLVYKNASQPLRTTGFETYVQATEDELELYLGYVYTNAKQLYNSSQPYLPLSARNKFASVASYEFSESFRAGIEAAYTGNQYLDNSTRTPGYLFMAAMVRYNIKNVSFVLNCENLLDYRQSKKEQIVFPPYNNPSFPDIWAPLEGRVINLSINIKW
jgi:outer membrane receptor for ferrienterochelin and colicins